MATRRSSKVVGACSNAAVPIPPHTWPLRWASLVRVHRSGSTATARMGNTGLLDRSAAPHRQPTAVSADAVAGIEDLRREQKWSASRIAFGLRDEGIKVSRRTVSRHLLALGPNRRKFIDPNGSSNREPGKIIVRRPGHLVHIGVKKVSRIPDGGGWRARGRGADRAKAAEPSKRRTKRRGYVYLHSVVDGYSRLAHTERCLWTTGSGRPARTV